MVHAVRSGSADVGVPDSRFWPPAVGTSQVPAVGSSVIEGPIMQRTAPRTVIGSVSASEFLVASAASLEVSDSRTLRGKT